MAEKNRPYIDAISCSGCSLCVENCPQNCLALTEPRYRGDTRTYVYIKDPAKCVGCGICAQNCPTQVITMCKPGTVPEHLTKGSASPLKKAYCRAFQAVMKVGNYFMGYRTPEYIEGPGCVKQLPEQILAKGVNRVLLVTDNGLVNLGVPNGLMDAMKEKGLPFELFSDIQPNPTDLNVEAGYKVFKENNCDGIIAFGGGSPMDCAKGIAAKNAHPRKKVSQLQGLLKVHKRICPFWAVPPLQVPVPKPPLPQLSPRLQPTTRRPSTTRPFCRNTQYWIRNSPSVFRLTPQQPPVWTLSATQ